MSKPELRTHPTIADFLREFYGSRWEALVPDAQQLLVADIEAIQEEEGGTCEYLGGRAGRHMESPLCKNFQPFPPRQAIQLLDERIENKLESYALTLMIGQRKAGKVL